MSVDWSKVDDAALALMHLTTSEHRGIARSWKGHDWDVLDRLYERGLISDPKTSAKSVVMTEEGLRRSRELFEQQFGELDAAPTARSKSVGPVQRGASSRCECGCGASVRDRDFVPGHDQKLRIQLEQRVGGLLELRALVESMEAYALGTVSLESLGLAVRAAVADSENAG